MEHNPDIIGGKFGFLEGSQLIIGHERARHYRGAFSIHAISDDDVLEAAILSDVVVL